MMQKGKIMGLFKILSNTYMNGQRETTKYLSHDSQSLVQDLRSGPLAYEACILPLQSQLSGNTNMM
jgi:hypothetical protein